MEELKYPIGKFVKPNEITSEQLSKGIDDIASFPERLHKAVYHLTDKQLDTPYRSGGWTIRQVVHHCSDSHMNSIIRFKLALTEDKPTIRPYYEDRWAELADSKSLDIQPALDLLRGLHKRWIVLLHSMTTDDLKRLFIHPEHNETFSIAENILNYAWHCNHHLAHITSLKDRLNWT